jgi:hypothetical protein
VTAQPQLLLAFLQPQDGLRPLKVAGLSESRFAAGRRAWIRGCGPTSCPRRTGRPPRMRTRGAALGCGVGARALTLARPAVGNHMRPGAAGFALGAGFRFLRPLAACDQALPRPTEGEDTQRRSLVRWRASARFTPASPSGQPPPSQRGWGSPASILVGELGLRFGFGVGVGASGPFVRGSLLWGNAPVGSGSVASRRTEGEDTQAAPLLHWRAFGLVRGRAFRVRWSVPGAPSGVVTGLGGTDRGLGLRSGARAGRARSGGAVRVSLGRGRG